MSEPASTPSDTPAVQADPADEELPELVLDEDGLEVPPYAAEADSGIVLRTPRVTIDLVGGTTEQLFDLITPRHFGPEQDRHPELAPDRIRVTPYGEATRVYRVDIQVEADEGGAGR